MRRKLLFLLTILSLSFQLPGEEGEIAVEVLQDIRATQAEVAMTDNDYKKAYSILNQNIIVGHFHLRTYQLLGELHLKHGKFKKSLRAYYYIVKGTHVQKILKIADNNSLIEILQKSPQPEEHTLNAYFKIASIWYDLYRENIYPKEYQKSLLRQAGKYFKICNWYKYRMGITNYYQALVEREKLNYSAATKHFFSVKQIYKEDITQNQHRLDTLNFLLAESLIQGGQVKAGSGYLKSIYTNEQNITSVRRYSEAYLDGLNMDTWSLSFTLGGNYDSNIHNFTNTKEDSLSLLKRANYFYSSKRHHYWSYLLSANIEEDLNTEKEISYYDTRDLFLGAEVKYDKLVNSITKLRYGLSRTYGRNNPDAGFSSFITSHNFTPEHVYNIVSDDFTGALGLQLPFSMVDDRTKDKRTMDYGFGISYKPLITTNWYAPVYALSITRIGQSSENDDSTEVRLGMTNLFSLTENLEIYSNLDYHISSNSNPDLAYKELTLELNGNYMLKKIKGFYLNFNLMRQITDEESSGSITKWKYFMGMTYSI